MEITGAQLTVFIAFVLVTLGCLVVGLYYLLSNLQSYFLQPKLLTAELYQTLGLVVVSGLFIWVYFENLIPQFEAHGQLYLVPILLPGLGEAIVARRIKHKLQRK